MPVRYVSTVDFQQMADIYNYYVKNSICTFDTKLFTELTFGYKVYDGQMYPWIVYYEKDTIYGYAKLGEFNKMESYIKTAELSIYVHHEYFGQGVGTALMKRMIDPPEGSRYGFPKEIPETVNNENIVEWFLEQGYPQTLIDQGMLDHCRMWMEEDKR